MPTPNPVTLEPVTLEQCHLELIELRKGLRQLTKLQEMELKEIRKNRFVNSRRLSAIGNRVVQLLLLGFVTAGGAFLYKEASPEVKSKFAESYINQIVQIGMPLVLPLLVGQQLLANSKEQKKLKQEDCEDEGDEDFNKLYKTECEEDS